MIRKIIKINEEDPDEKMFLDFINRIETKNYDSCVSYVGEVIDSHVATFASEFANVSETVVDVESFFNDAVEMTKQIEKMMFLSLFILIRIFFRNTNNYYPRIFLFLSFNWFKSLSALITRTEITHLWLVLPAIGNSLLCLGFFVKTTMGFLF